MKKVNLSLCVLSLLTLQACSDDVGFSSQDIALPVGSDAIAGPEGIPGGAPTSQGPAALPDGQTAENPSGNPADPNSIDPNSANPSGSIPDGSNPGSGPGGSISSGRPTSDTVTGSTGGGNTSTTETIAAAIRNEGTTTEFGSTSVFRVGDGAASATSCKSDVDSFSLSGSEYSFIFKVEEDATTLNFYVNRLCGIDTTTGNVITLVNSATNGPVVSNLLPQRVVSPTSVALEPFSQAVTLNKGTYSIRVVSNPNLQQGGDRDDFLIGNIKIVGNKPVIGTGIQTK